MSRGPDQETSQPQILDVRQQNPQIGRVAGICFLGVLASLTLQPRVIRRIALSTPFVDRLTPEEAAIALALKPERK